jgi:hypothetical protein
LKPSFAVSLLVSAMSVSSGMSPVFDSALRPSGVSSMAQAITSAIGKPMIASPITNRTLHSGNNNPGNITEATSTITHATIRVYDRNADHVAALQLSIEPGEWGLWHNILSGLKLECSSDNQADSARPCHQGKFNPVVFE